MDQLFIDDEVIIPGVGIDIDTLSENCNKIPNKTFAAFKRHITKKSGELLNYTACFLEPSLFSVPSLSLFILSLCL